MVTIEKLRRWAITDESQDTELQMALAAAEGYLHNAGVPMVDSPARDMALLQLTLYFFEQRAPGQNNQYAPLPPCLRPLIWQLRGDGANDAANGML